MITPSFPFPLCLPFPFPSDADRLFFSFILKRKKIKGKRKIHKNRLSFACAERNQKKKMQKRKKKTGTQFPLYVRLLFSLFFVYERSEKKAKKTRALTAHVPFRSSLEYVFSLIIMNFVWGRLKLR